MASKQAFDRLLRKGHPVDKSVYNTYDRLESNADVRGLMEVLSSVGDKNKSPAKFTLNNIVGNPDFEKIRESSYSSYHYELFTRSYNRYEDSSNVLSLIKEGVERHLFQPQLHGREHLQVNNWLKKLQTQTSAFIDAFKEGMYTINPYRGNSCYEECLDGMATYSDNDFPVVSHSLNDGQEIFERTWGFRSKSVIAPCYTWHSALDTTFKASDIKYIQGSKAQRVPQPNYTKKIKRHYAGQKSSSGLIYLIRNVHFEQVENKYKDWVDTAMREIATAFYWRKPAVISTHRVNYIGSIDATNRSRNLQSLERLLRSIVKYYPTVEFMSSDELGVLIEKG